MLSWNETGRVRQQQLRRAQRSALPTWPTSLPEPRTRVPALLSWLALLLPRTDACSLVSLGNLPCQALQLLLIEHFVIHHAQHKLFHGAATKTVDNVFHRPDSDIAATVRRLVDECFALHLMRDIFFLFQPAQHGADGRILHGTRGNQRFPAAFGRDR